MQIQQNIGDAQEMYSTDYSGHYASNLGKLTPNYTKTLPRCPGADEMTYQLQTGQDAPGNAASSSETREQP